MPALGEKQIRSQADKAGSEVLGPMFKALGDLAVAAAEANQQDELRAAAKAKAQRILDCRRGRDRAPQRVLVAGMAGGT